MKRVAIAVALSTIWLAMGCSAPSRFVAVAVDPARDAQCAAEFPRVTGLASLDANTLTLAAPASVAPAPGTAAPIVLPAGTEIVPLDAVLDRDEHVAVAITRMRQTWADCRAVVAYRQDFDRRMQQGK